MLTTDDPRAFWSSISRLTGWRLIACEGLYRATFATSHHRMVEIDWEMAEALDTTVGLIGDLADTAMDVMDLTESAVYGPARDKRDAKKVLDAKFKQATARIEGLCDELPSALEYYDERRGPAESAPVIPLV